MLRGYMLKPNLFSHFLNYMYTDLEINRNRNNKNLLKMSVENAKQFVDEKEGFPCQVLCSSCR